MGIFNFFKRNENGFLAEKNAKLWFDVAKDKAHKLDVAKKALEFYAKKNDKNARTAKKALKEIAK